LAGKRMRLCETVPLGEKRFVAIAQVDGKQFLVGAAPNGISLLAELDVANRFAGLLASAEESERNRE
jgi:flagellar biogenesis protein FliO